MPNYRFGPFQLDSAQRLLIKDGRAVTVSAKPFEVLLILVRGAGRVVERDELMSAVWPDTAVEENNLTQAISSLRKVLGETPEHRYITTIPGRGYQFVASLEADHGPVAPAPAPKRRAYVPLAIALLVIAAAAGTWIARVVGRPDPKTLAVLPFQPLGDVGDAEHLGLGMADALITRLSNLKQVTVRPMSSVSKYAGTSKGVVAVAGELGVQSVLEGKIQNSGDRLRVSVQLLEGKTGRPSWAAQFDEKSKDIFVLEDSISRQVAGALALELNGADQNRLVRHSTENLDAYQAYLKGRYAYWNKKGLRKAANEFERAAELDPRYAVAHAALADCYNLLSLYSGAPAWEAGPKAKASAMKAMSLDDSLPEAHVALAFAWYIFDWDWTAAEKEFHRAIAIDPRHAPAHQFYSMYLGSMGRNAEALAEAKNAAAIDPSSPVFKANVGMIANSARDFDLAIAELRQAVEMDPNLDHAHNYLATSYRETGKYEEALGEFRKSLALIGRTEDASAQIGYVYAVMGKTEQARRILNAVTKQALESDKPAYDVAYLHAALGERDRAFQWLEKAFEERFPWLVILNVDPRMKALHPDPRFKQLLRRIGLPEVR